MVNLISNYKQRKYKIIEIGARTKNFMMKWSQFPQLSQIRTTLNFPEQNSIQFEHSNVRKNQNWIYKIEDLK